MLNFVFYFMLIAIAPDTGSDTKGSPTSATKPPPLRIAVVIHKDNPIEKIALPDLRRIFLRKKLVWDDHVDITVYERHTKNPIREQFARTLLKKSPTQLRDYWMNLKLTRALKPPKPLRSARLVKQYLKRVKGAVSYLYESEVDDSVKVLHWLEVHGE